MTLSPHHLLQRVLVRMLYDPGFAASVSEDPEALAALGLPAREQGFLRATDPRAFRHDPLRARRTLRALGEELKTSVTLALRETGRLAFLDAFFSSDSFHRAVMERGSLAQALGEYLLHAGLRTPLFVDVVRLESELARARRAWMAAGGPEWTAPPWARGASLHVARAPGVAVGRFSPDVLTLVQAVERFLFEVSLMPAMVLVEDAPPLVLPKPTGAPATPLGLIPTSSGISLVELEPAIYDMIERVQGIVSVTSLDRSLAESLLDDEVLIAQHP